MICIKHLWFSRHAISFLSNVFNDHFPGFRNLDSHFLFDRLRMWEQSQGDRRDIHGNSISKMLNMSVAQGKLNTSMAISRFLRDAIMSFIQDFANLIPIKWKELACICNDFFFREATTVNTETKHFSQLECMWKNAHGKCRLLSLMYVSFV